MSDDKKLTVRESKLIVSGERPGNVIEKNSDKKSEVTSDTIAVGHLSAPSKDEGKTANTNKTKKKSRKGRIIRRVSLGFLACLIGVGIGVLFFINYYKNYLLNKITYITTVPSEEATIVNESGEVVSLAELTQQTEHAIIVSNEDQDEIHNYLLIGVDSRSRGYSESGKGGLADVNMVMSVNVTKGTIKMISIARDCYAFVPGYSRPMKINAAMSLGGPDVLVMTDENMLRIDIDGYAYVNFYNMARVIDAVHGVYVYVSEAELYAEGGLNHNLEELNVLYGLDPDQDKLNTTGSVWLNGRQAVAYARIRKIDSDYARSARQVEVLRSLLNRFMELGTTQKLAAIDDILGMIATNIPADQIEDLAMDFLPSLDNVSIEYMQLPIQGCSNQGMYGGEWSIRPNWNAEIPFVHYFFYGENTLFDKVDDIPSAPATENCYHLAQVCPNRDRYHQGDCDHCIHLEDLMK